MIHLQIDPEFANLHRPLTVEERAQLHADLDTEGILHPLVLWREERILLDGHNRLAWAKAHRLKDVPNVELSFEDRTAALRWAIRHQLGRRNLTPDEAALLRGKDYNLEKLPAGGRTGRTFSGRQNGDAKTVQRLAKAHGVSPKTIERDGQFAAAVETVAKHVPEIADVVKTGASPFTRQETIDVASRMDLDPECVERVRDQLAAPPEKQPKRPRPERGGDKDSQHVPMQEAWGTVIQGAMTLDRLGKAARVAFWKSSPERTKAYLAGLRKLHDSIGQYIREVEQ